MIAENISHVRQALILLRNCGQADAARQIAPAIDNLSAEYDRLYRIASLLLPLAEQVERKLGDLVPIPNKGKILAEAREFTRLNPAKHLSALGVENEGLLRENAYLKDSVAAENTELRRRITDMAAVIQKVRDAGFIPNHIHIKDAVLAQKAAELARDMKRTADYGL